MGLQGKQLGNLPDGTTSKVRSVALEPAADALVYAFMQQQGLPTMSAALRLIVDEGLRALGQLQDANPRAAARDREVARKAKMELGYVVQAAVDNWLAGRGSEAPPVVMTEDAALGSVKVVKATRRLGR